VWGNAEREKTLRKARSGSRVSERNGKVRSSDTLKKSKSLREDEGEVKFAESQGG